MINANDPVDEPRDVGNQTALESTEFDDEVTDTNDPVNEPREVGNQTESMGASGADVSHLI